ncbi:unnamed protein product, partial [Discosporangium mesarthrocarpum]
FKVSNPQAAHPAMYVPGDGIVYCPIAKVACAEWRKTMRWMLGIPDWDTGPIHEMNGIPKVANRQRYEVERMMNDDSWVKFVVVREPAERLLSAFLNKCAGGEWFNCPYLEFMPAHFKGQTRQTPVTDRAMLEYIRDDPKSAFLEWAEGVERDVRKSGCKVNSHWRPQHCFCGVAQFLPAYHVIPFQNMT